MIVRYAERGPKGPPVKWHGVAVFSIWLALTLAGLVAFWNSPFLPDEFAHEAHISDDAFKLLVRLAIPVAALVLAMLIVALFSFRTHGEPADEGPPLRGNRWVSGLWIAITSALTLVVIINPGLVGLAQIRGGSQEDLVVRVEGSRWFWKITYPGDPSTEEDDVVTTDELVLPIQQRAKFEITATDVLHSFWIPAFRIKMDAVPGHPTVTYATPSRIGTSASDWNLRLQCAELCGTGHSIMGIPVRVVEPVEFEAWLAEARAGGTAAACEPDGPELQITASAISFDTKCLAAPADEPFTITVDNQGSGVPHNISVARDESWQEVVVAGSTFAGVGEDTVKVDALPAGTYFFRCDVHPTPAMSGTLIVGEPGASGAPPVSADSSPSPLDMEEM